MPLRYFVDGAEQGVRSFRGNRDICEEDTLFSVVPGSMWEAAVDPMAQAEEETRRKEESERKDLLQTLYLDSFYFNCRDLASKGKDVQPSGKQRKAVQLLAQSVKFGSSVRRWTAASLVGLDSGSFSSESTAAAAGTDKSSIDLLDKPRIFINSGPVCRQEKDSSGRRKALPRFLMLFNDVLLILTNSKKDKSNSYEVEQILRAEYLRVRHVFVANTRSDVVNSPAASKGTAGAVEDHLRCSFELVSVHDNVENVIRIICEDEDHKMIWLADIEAMLLGYHMQTEKSKKIGWFHEIVQGTFHSAAYLGDMALLRKYLRALQDRIDHGLTGGGRGSHETRNTIGDVISGSSRCSIGAATPGSKSKNLLSPPQLLRAQDVPLSIDATDLSGMTAIHWAVLKQHETSARLLLDRGADVDALQRGGNTPLLLAAITGSETMVRLLIEQGADIYARNSREYDAVFMSVLYGHNTKGLPWLLQLLTSKGLQLNEIDSTGATPLHLCAKKNLSRPVRMLVDYGADVNAKHSTLKLTPLHMACSHPHPEVETIRSLLDNGAFPNWRDVNGLSAFDVVLQTQQNEQAKIREQQTNYGLGGAITSLREIIDATDDESVTALSTTSCGGNDNALANDDYGVATVGEVTDLQDSRAIRTPSARWRAMEGTLQQVGDWAVRALPALLEISKRGGRCFRPEKEFSALRPSFRTAVEEAQADWHRQRMPRNFMEFVLAREQAGEELRLHKAQWASDRSESVCQLCSCAFSIRNRRHHCRSCGILTCDDCSTKRLLLHSADFISSRSNASTGSTSNSPLPWEGDESPSDAVGSSAPQRSKDELNWQRACDGCFNRLCYEAAQPSADHYRVKQLKRCAMDVMNMMEDLIEALDDPDGDPHCINASLRETLQLTRDLDSLVHNANFGSNESGKETASAIEEQRLNGTNRFSGLFRSSLSLKSSPRGDATDRKTRKPFLDSVNSSPGFRNSLMGPISGSTASMTPTPKKKSMRFEKNVSPALVRSGEQLVSALKLRDEKLAKAEHLVAKFLEAADGYHKVTRKLIEKKNASNRLWSAGRDESSRFDE